MLQSESEALDPNVPIEEDLGTLLLLGGYKLIDR
jgi:hypothetical protein